MTETNYSFQETMTKTKLKILVQMNNDVATIAVIKIVTVMYDMIYT